MAQQYILRWGSLIWAEGRLPGTLSAIWAFRAGTAVPRSRSQALGLRIRGNSSKGLALRAWRSVEGGPTHELGLGVSVGRKGEGAKTPKKQIGYRFGGWRVRLGTATSEVFAILELGELNVRIHDIRWVSADEVLSY